jgi:hypothetical protein
VNVEINQMMENIVVIVNDIFGFKQTDICPNDAAGYIEQKSN